MAETEGALAPVLEPPSAGTQAAPLTGRLPEIPEPRAAVLQALFRQPRRWTVEGGEVLRLEPGGVPPQVATFALDSDGASVALAFDPHDGSVPDGLHWSDHAGRSRVLAWSLAHERQLVRLSQALGMTLVPAVGGGDDPVAAATAGEGAWLRFRLGPAGAAGGAALAGTAWLPLSRLQSLLVRADAADETEAERAMARWTVLPGTVAIALRGPRIPQAEWAGLSPGGVIVIGRASAPPQVRARGAGRAWPVQPTAEGWRVEGPGVPDSDDQENEMSEDEQQAAQAGDAAEAASPNPVGSLPVQVGFELGRLEVGLGDLAQLQPGYVFALPAHLQGANVAIRANGREVGRGELVAVGDTLGVRLLAWS